MKIFVRSKKVSIAVLSAFLLLPTLAIGQPSLTYVKLAETADSKISAAASLYVESGALPTTKISKSSKRDDKFGAISQYYSLMNDGQFAKVQKLFFQPDGSREWLMRDQERYPEKYKNSVDYVSVKFLREYRWGDYSIFYVSRSDENDRVSKWVDVSVCPESRCFISSILFSPDSATDVLSAVMYELNSGNRVEKGFNYNVNFDVLPDFGSQYPVTIYLNINADSKQEIFPKTVDSGLYQNISSYFRELRETNDSYVSAEISVEEARSRFLKTNEEYWSNFDKDKAFVQFQGDGSSARSKLFSEMAYLDYLTSFSKISLIGTLASGGSKFIILNAEADEKSNLLIFMLGSNGMLKQQVDNTALQQVLMSDVAANAIQKWIAK